MQKLEEILHAEEAARHAVASAHERAETIVRDALAEARRAMNEGHAQATADAGLIRAERLDAARAEAEQLHRAAEQEVAETIASARSKLAQAVAKVVGELVG